MNNNENEKIKVNFLAIIKASLFDDNFQKLRKDLNSFTYELELKNDKVKTLQADNQRLEFKIQEIPVKDIEIQKLKHRNNDLKTAEVHLLELQK